jgi:hypothetical protein
MDEPKRLLESGSPRARALLAAGKGEMPGERTEGNVLSALGLGVGVGAATGTGTWAHAVARLLGKSLVGLRVAVSSKIGIGVLAASVAGGAGYWGGQAHERAIQRAATAQSAPPPALPLRAEVPRDVPMSVSAAPPRPTAPPLPAPSLPASPAPSPAPSLPPPPAARPNHVAAAVAPTAAPDAPARSSRARVDSTMVAQLESIRAARDRVAQGDGQGALSKLDAYEAQYPNGALEEEAMVLRVRALRLVGDSAGASRAQALFESRFPASVHRAAPAR